MWLYLKSRNSPGSDTEFCTCLEDIIRMKSCGHMELQKAEQGLLEREIVNVLVFVDQANRGSTAKNPK